MASASCQVTHWFFFGWVNPSPHDGIPAHRASNPRPFGYESYALTNSAITARPTSSRVRGFTEVQIRVRPKGGKRCRSARWYSSSASSSIVNVISWSMKYRDVMLICLQVAILYMFRLISNSGSFQNVSRITSSFDCTPYSIPILVTLPWICRILSFLD